MFGKRWPTRVVFIRNENEITMPVDLGFNAVTIGVGEIEVWIPAGQTKYIAWPEGVDHWTYDGAPGPKQRFWRPVE